MLAFGLDATDIKNNNDNPPPPGGPGGKVESISFKQIDSVPNPGNCGSGVNSHAITDQTGNNSFSSTTVDTVAGGSAVILSGFIGNVAPSAFMSADAPSFLKVTDNVGATLLTQSHDTSTTGVKGWFTAESWANNCANWRASVHYVVHGMESLDDVLLVPIADVPHTICYIDGIEGNGSASRSDGHGGSVQPYAQIYIDPTTGYHLKVSPPASTDPNGGVGARATCLSLKP